MTVALERLVLDVEALPTFGALPYQDGVIVGGEPRPAGTELCVPVRFDPAPDRVSLLEAARRFSGRSDTTGTTFVLHYSFMPQRRSARAFALGRMLLERRTVVGLAGPVITTGKRLPFDLDAGWRGIPHRVRVRQPDGETSPDHTVWEMMSPALYAAWRAESCI